MIKFKTFNHEYQVVAQLNEWETEGYDLTKYFIRITMTPVKVSGLRTVFNIFYDATLDEKRGIERVMEGQSDKVDNEDETLKGMVKVFCTPKGDIDELATEVSIRGTKIYPPKGMLIGRITPIDNSFFVEFVGNDEELTDIDKKAIVDANVKMSLAGMFAPEIKVTEECGNKCSVRFEVKQVYADRPPEYTMVEVPMDEALHRNIPKTSDFPYDNRVKFLDYAETYLKAKGLIPIDNVSLTRYEIIHDERNLTSTASIDEDENIDTFIEYLTTQHKYMHSEKSKRRCEKLIKQMKMAKIISEIMELKGDEEITDTDKKDENAVKDFYIKPSGKVEIGYAGAWDFDDFTRELTRIETNYLGKTGEMDYCTFLAVLSHIRNVYEKYHKSEGLNNFEKKALIEEARKQVKESIAEESHNLVNMTDANLTERHKEIYCMLSSLAKQVGNCQFCVFPMDDPDFTEVEDGTLFISVGGGHNGGSAVGGFKENWEEYFDTLSKFVRMASDSGLRLWMVDASNDCLDDMFTVRFGVREQ